MMHVLNSNGYIRHYHVNITLEYFLNKYFELLQQYSRDDFLKTVVAPRALGINDDFKHKVNSALFLRKDNLATPLFFTAIDVWMEINCKEKVQS